MPSEHSLTAKVRSVVANYQKPPTYHLKLASSSKMNHERTPPETVVDAAKLYHDRVICPSESWRAINDATLELDLISLLNDLNSSEQELIRKYILNLLNL